MRKANDKITRKQIDRMDFFFFFFLRKHKFQETELGQFMTVLGGDNWWFKEC